MNLQTLSEELKKSAAADLLLPIQRAECRKNLSIIYNFFNNKLGKFAGKSQISATVETSLQAIVANLKEMLSDFDEKSNITIAEQRARINKVQSYLNEFKLNLFKDVLTDVKHDCKEWLQQNLAAKHQVALTELQGVATRELSDLENNVKIIIAPAVSKRPHH